MTDRHLPDDLIAIFNRCFQHSHQTKLAYGGDEPVYIPANSEQPHHTIYFAHGFFSSALHESAHWLLAGLSRRALLDYGYWYIPDGRTPEQQTLFQQVEIKPQALEWLLSDACGYPFRISCDNLTGTTAESAQFAAAVERQRLHYACIGLPPRAQTFYTALLSHYQRFELS